MARTKLEITAARSPIFDRPFLIFRFALWQKLQNLFVTLLGIKQPFRLPRRHLSGRNRLTRGILFVRLPTVFFISGRFLLILFFFLFAFFLVSLAVLLLVLLLLVL